MFPGKGSPTDRFSKLRVSMPCSVSCWASANRPPLALPNDDDDVLPNASEITEDDAWGGCAGPAVSVGASAGGGGSSDTARSRVCCSAPGSPGAALTRLGYIDAVSSLASFAFCVLSRLLCTAAPASCKSSTRINQP